MGELNIFKKLRYVITLISILFIFIFGFYIFENIYLGRGNTADTVVLGEELFQRQSAENETSTDDDKVNTGSIEYTRTTFVFTNTGETIVTETWLSPETLEGKTNEIVTSADNKVEKNYTAYTKDGAKHYINIQRDQNGKAVSGIEFYYSDERAKENSEDLKRYDIFEGRKAMYKDMTFWKDKGTVASGGKSLRMLLCGDEKNGNTTIVYVDESTGFPAKEESFVNGKPHSTMTYEFRYVESDDKLFDADTEGVEVEMLGQIDSIRLK